MEYPSDDRIHRLHGGEQDLEPGEDPEKRYGHRVRAFPLQRNAGRHQAAEVGDEPTLPEDESAGLRHGRYQRERPVPRGKGEGAGRGKTGKNAGIQKSIERRSGRNGDATPRKDSESGRSSPSTFSGKRSPRVLLFLGNRIDNDFAKKIARETGSQVFLATPDGVFAESYDIGVRRGIQSPAGQEQHRASIGPSSTWTEKTTGPIPTCRSGSSTNGFAS